MLWCFGYEVYGISVPWPGMEPEPSVLKVEVLTTEPPSKSQKTRFEWKSKQKHWCFFYVVRNTRKK